MTDIGMFLPDLQVETSLGSTPLSAYVGHQLVLYFYPKDDTPGCTAEGQDFTAQHGDFLAANTQVVGVSRDSLAAHRRFIDKHGLTITLISDPDEALCRAFDVIKTKNMYGKQVQGIERSTFLFDASGHLRQAWRAVKVPGHAEEVLHASKVLHALAKA